MERHQLQQQVEGLKEEVHNLQKQVQQVQQTTHQMGHYRQRLGQPVSSSASVARHFNADLAYSHTPNKNASPALLPEFNVQGKEDMMFQRCGIMASSLGSPQLPLTSAIGRQPKYPQLPPWMARNFNFHLQRQQQRQQQQQQRQQQYQTTTSATTNAVSKPPVQPESSNTTQHIVPYGYLTPSGQQPLQEQQQLPLTRPPAPPFINRKIVPKVPIEQKRPTEVINKPRKNTSLNDVNGKMTALYEKKWYLMYSRLLQYKSNFGDCNVCTTYKEDVQLSWWVRTQRQNKDKLSQERKDMLDGIGFAWQVREYECWDDVFDRLLGFREVHGHCNVPKGYQPDPKLAKWVSHQKTAITNGIIQEQRLNKLQSIGFKCSKSGMLSQKVTDTWTPMFNLLLKYKSLHGNCLVPYRYEDRLGEWVSRQRVAYKRGSLRKDRLELLEKNGFVWVVGEKEPTKGSSKHDDQATIELKEESTKSIETIAADALLSIGCSQDPRVSTNKMNLVGVTASSDINKCLNKDSHGYDDENDGIAGATTSSSATNKRIVCIYDEDGNPIWIYDERVWV